MGTKYVMSIRIIVTLLTLVLSTTGTTVLGGDDHYLRDAGGNPIDNNHKQQKQKQQWSNRRLLRRRLSMRTLPEHVSGGPAIAVLTTKQKEDIEELCIALRSLIYLQGDNLDKKPKRAPVLIFNEGDITYKQMEAIGSCTDRVVAFPLVDLNSFFPRGFDPEKEWQNVAVGDHYFESLPKRARWSYQQMIRFWTTGIWKHPAIQQFDTIMRIDTDSCFLNPHEYENPSLTQLPGMRGRFVYQSINPPPGKSTYVQGLYDFAVEYMQKNGIQVANPELWQAVEDAWHGPRHTLPVFKTNFEINRREFFQSKPVMNWHEALTEHEPFGVWRHRWGDAQTRFLTMAMFAAPENVLITPDYGYMHGRGLCEELLGDLMVSL